MTTPLDENWSYYKRSRQALEIAFSDTPGLDGLALELSLKDGLATVTWVRVGTERIKSAIGLKIGGLRK